MSNKVLICKKTEDEPAYCPDRYKLLQISRPCKNSRCFQKVIDLFNLKPDSFPIRDSKRLECVRKCFEKKNSTLSKLSIFRAYANSNEMSGPLHARINGCILYLILIILPSPCFLFKIFLRSSKL